MSPYTITIKHDNTPDRIITIENENGMYLFNRKKQDHIEIQYGGYDDTLYLNQESFLELYELMTALKKYIDTDAEKEGGM